jgi:hypothetical protein
MADVATRQRFSGPVAHAWSAGKSAASKSGSWSAGKGRLFRRFETNGTKKDVILKNEPKKLFKYNKKLHG